MDQCTLVQIEMVSFRNHFKAFLLLRGLIWIKMQYYSVFLGFLGSFLIIMQNGTLLLYMRKIKGENFELQGLQQFATPQDLLFKLQIIICHAMKLDFFASICVCDLQVQIHTLLYLISFGVFDKITDFSQL